MTTDPVCNMTIDPQKAAAKSVHKRVTYYFCSEGCHKAFSANPDSYAKAGKSAKHSPHPRGSD